ncbi:hypothetical protein MNBD_GAMMA06-1732 [hydrothermal vent metagenome]|uniref:Uncharacterized protein n=1 Tax=hydrothermal vent metagenome TaxID=652676 RepID=A0A3B0W3J5_9ZZZZ
MKPVLDIKSSNRFFNAFKYTENTSVNGKDVLIKYTERAKKALESRNSQLVIEMQIYFSCVVQKRVLFHDDFEFETTPINDKLAVAIRPVESQSCDPEYFAKNHPEKRVLDSSGAKKMKAKELIFDYKDNKWIGAFSIV